ncbi:PREDICTED: apoptosis-inducing factor 3-like isoform X2 [Priapulus caudatus]|uniref:Apoptosis-inducing factor 3-like isoform X2 n=1 Tax=Priapulus caudatus TaxID=37621 RepID=A0ABM1E6Q9_PRICU|nr:PREDICTED: apoptosis-inducing factor 3-like isoform X2 [Priapulus caudatus]XP_014667881.1 PREDICTED: apoptosis-inducing factor 3-like isoform X2 [Priapulus caudatus]
MGSGNSKDSYNLQRAPADMTHKGSTPDTIEAVVCKKDDLKDGEMKQVEVGDGKVLLIREDGAFHAIGSKCSHYGAPLVKGALCNSRVRCPWHGACFSIKTGDIEDFPGLDSVPIHEVIVRGNDVVVKASVDALSKDRRMKTMHKCDSKDNRTFLIIGGGPSSVTCAETLRQQGFCGKIVIATREAHLPYDKPKLSKALDFAPAKIALRDAAFYSTYDIQLLNNKDAVKLNLAGKNVAFKDGDTISYDKLMIATGGTPRTLDCPGSDLENIFVLRTPDDGNLIAERAKQKKVIIIGTSFIGMEVAAFLAGKAGSVSVIGHGNVPFERVLGAQIGNAMMKLFVAKKVEFYMENGVKEFVGHDGKLSKVILTSGEKLDADVCVVGAGVTPCTKLLNDSGLEMTDRGHVVVDKRMGSSNADVFACGDIVVFPLFLCNDKRVNIQHWQMASQHGKVAAFNMLGTEKDICSVPYFWTAFFGKSVRYTGYAEGFDDIIVCGNVENVDDLKFVAYFTKGNNVIAVASMNCDPIVSQAAEVMANCKVITKEEITSEHHSCWVAAKL